MLEVAGEFGMDSCLGNGPGTVRAVQAVERRSIDIEAMLQWAVARSGRLPWDRARDRELAFDRGYTAQLRRRPPMSWSLAEACAGLRLGGRALPAQRAPGPDAELVLLAVRRLGDPATAAIVVACARARIRPDWMEGIEPRRVERWARCARRHRRVVRIDWEPCSPQAIRAAREVYASWHAALAALADTLSGELSEWNINGLAAPAEPWAAAGKTTA